MQCQSDDISGSAAMRTSNIVVSFMLFAASPLWAQQTTLPTQTQPQSSPRTLPLPRQLSAPPAKVTVSSKPITLDYAALYKKEQEKNRRLEAENQTLKRQLEEISKPGGSLVHAYCDGDYISRNTAGASNNCGVKGYACEPVSGLCRTSCQGSDTCAQGYTCDDYDHQCKKNG